MVTAAARPEAESLFAGLSLLGLGLGALAEAVAETATHHLQVAHAAGAGGLPPLGLDGPVVCYRKATNISKESGGVRAGRVGTYMNATWQRDSRTGRKWTSGCGRRSVHSDGTECASCCGVYQSSRYPSSVIENRN